MHGQERKNTKKSKIDPGSRHDTKTMPGTRRAAALTPLRILILRAAVCVLLLMVLGGCGIKEYKRKDIEEYVREELGLKGFKVSRESVEYTEHDDGYIDYLWTVTEKDGTVFYVLDDRYYGMEWTTNTLRDNWNTVHMQEHMKHVQYPGFVLEVDDGIPGWVGLRGQFRSRSELHARIDTLNMIARDIPEGMRLAYELDYMHPYRQIGDYEQRTGDSSGSVKGGEKLGYEYAEQNLLSIVIDMRYADGMADFTEEEIRDYVRDNSDRVGVRQADGSVLFYEDLCMDRFSYGLSLGTIYEILVRSGYPVEGTIEQYSFTSPDGSTYTFSNDFKEDEWYYYLLNGEKTPMESYFYNHWSYGRMKDLCGLEVMPLWAYEKEQAQSAETQTDEQTEETTESQTDGQAEQSTEPQTEE